MSAETRRSSALHALKNTRRICWPTRPLPVTLLSTLRVGRQLFDKVIILELYKSDELVIGGTVFSYALHTEKFSL
jgi:hypothetical protein